MAHKQDSGEIGIKVGDVIPDGTFGYVPYTPELEDGVSAIHELISRRLASNGF